MAGYLKRPPTGLKDRMVKVQTTLVASPGFGPIFGRLARNGPVFGIGGFEPSRPPSRNRLLAALRDTRPSRRPLVGVDRTSVVTPATSAFDPKQTFAVLVSNGVDDVDLSKVCAGSYQPRDDCVGCAYQFGRR